MSISEFSVNYQNKCGNCKDFLKYDETGIWGQCLSNDSKIRNKNLRTELSKACNYQRRKNE